ncbi:transposase domain-containing protein [Streptomyces chryseus]
MNPGQVESSGERLSDRIALGVLTRVFPPGLVDEVIAECGRREQRARLLTQGLERVRQWEKPWRVPTTAAIGRARRRLGPEPLKVLFDRVCRPVATPESAGA